ncbi:MAG: hypothetical protein HW418_2736, partial [Anaerolineales bacterium]|nr:hypothetical protein [Anaerolineales bacterium]
FLSQDSGDSWSALNDGPGPNPIVYSIAVDPNDSSKVYAVTPDGVYRLAGILESAETLSPQAEQARAFTDPNEFQSAISGLGAPTVIDFEGIDAKPVSDTFKGRKPFDGATYASRGIAFASPYETPLFVAPGGLFWNASNSLSVGQFPNDANARKEDTDDDLTIRLNPPAMAVGFTLVDLSKREATHVTWLDASGAVVAEIPLPNNYENEKYRAFVGIVSPNRPIATIRVDEGPPKDGDDVNYDDFIFIPASTSASQAEQARAFAEPILAAIADRPPDFSEDFSKPTSGWIWQGTTGKGERFAFVPVPASSFQDGALILSARDANFWNPTCSNFINHVTRADLTLVDLTQAGAEMSVLWRIYPNADHYRIRLRLVSETWELVRHGPSGAQPAILASGSAHINGLGTANRIAVIVNDSQFAIYLNDAPLAYFEDDALPLGGGGCVFDFAGSGDVTVALDNVKVWNLANVPGLP